LTLSKLWQIFGHSDPYPSGQLYEETLCSQLWAVGYDNLTNLPFDAWNLAEYSYGCLPKWWKQRNDPKNKSFSIFSLKFKISNNFTVKSYIFPIYHGNNPHLDNWYFFSVIFACLWKHFIQRWWQREPLLLLSHLFQVGL